MKQVTLTLVILIFLFSCKKDGSPVSEGTGVTSASFTTNKSTYYLGEPVVLTADQSTGGDGAYNWSYGDGANQNGNYNSTHSFQTGGVYTINLKVNNLNYSKKVNVRAYNASYQIKNGLSEGTLKSLYMFTNMTGSSKENIKQISALNNGATTDTVFVNMRTNDDPTLLLIQFHVFNLPDLGNFQANDRHYLNLYNNVVFTIDNKTPLVKLN